jgi:hypothetical protein
MLDADIVDIAYLDSRLLALTADDIAEGIVNRYYTDNRARSAIGVTGGILSYDSATGVISLTSSAFNYAARHSISVAGDLSYDVNTGVISYTATANLTTEQIQDAVAPLITSGVNTGIAAVYDDANNRINFTVTANTDQITEGATNLYFSTSRARASLSAGAGLSYNTILGQYSVNPFFGYVKVPGHSNVLATGTGDFLQLTPDAGLSINTDPTNRNITFSVDPFFTNISVLGQGTINADVPGDTLNIVPGSGISMTVLAGTNTLVVAATGGPGGSLDPIEQISTAMIYG